MTGRSAESPGDPGVDAVSAPADLRTRRRLQTRDQIHRAALDLFDTHGVRATTVEQIADRAGVSSRTFFRHFTTKEQAALPGQERLRHAIEQLPTNVSTPAAALEAVEQMAASVLAAEPRDSLQEHRRVHRILSADADVRGLAAAQEQELTSLIADRLAAGLDPVSARLVAEVGMLTWRASWARWAELSQEGRTPDPAELYGQFRSRLRALLTAGPESAH